ncbi:MAG: ion transporter [Gammaproteobacteria bacterium]
MRIRARTHEILDTPAHSPLEAWVHRIIITLIVLSIVALVLETVEPLGADYRTWFWSIEVVAVSVFTVEYIARVWAAVESPRYAHPVWGRLRYMASPLAIFDLLAILPFYLAFIAVDLRALRALRLFRILRLAKLTRYSAAMQALGRVFTAKRYELGVTLAIGSVLWLIASTLIYYVENPAQPDVYTSIPATMWYSVATLTTVGYGDLYPVTGLGRLLGGVISVLGIAMFALPTAILGAAFVDELERVKRGEVNDARGRCEHCGQPLP